MNAGFYIGEFIQKKMEEKERKADWLAKRIPCHRNNVYRIYQQKHIHPELLTRISIILKFNFFSYYFGYVDKKIK